jgi:hypothetical protein
VRAAPTPAARRNGAPKVRASTAAAAATRGMNASAGAATHLARHVRDLRLLS